MRLYVVVNANARRAGRVNEHALARVLPCARVSVTRSLEDVAEVARHIADETPDLVLAAGGDGTAMALLDRVRAERRARGETGGALLRIGLLKLGTGNGWARSIGAPGLGTALRHLATFLERGYGPHALPAARFHVLDVEGRLAPFAGTGWDAELVDDFHAQKEEPGLLPRRVRSGLLGYLNGLATRTVPRNLRLSRVEVEIVNTGAPALGVDRRGRPFQMEHGEEGTVLYRGPVSVCGAGTSTQWGFGFRAFPFARLLPGRFNLRMYVGTTKEALARVPLLWTGKHPLDKMHTWLLDRCTMRFSRPVPFQIGGDLLGHRDEIEYALAPETALVLDWRALGRMIGGVERKIAAALEAHVLRPALSQAGFLGH
jgi:hypothetical protein